MEELSIKKLTFTKRPIPLPADYRPMYKIAVIVLILKYCCRSETSRLLKLHLLSWSLAAKRNRKMIIEYIESNYTNEFAVWGIEPALNRALLLAVGENYCEIIDGKKYHLTEKGIQFFKLIEKEQDLFTHEKALLKLIGKSKITDTRIASMTRQWNIIYAKN